MKRILLFLIVFIPLLGFSKTTPQIVFDKVNSDGSRLIGCSNFPLNKFTDKYKTWISLSVIQIDDSVNYYISLKITASSPLHIKSNSSALIKLSTDKVIHLKTDFDYSDDIGEYQNMANISIYTVNSMYPVSENLIQEITKYGIKKIRIETNLENIDKELNNNKLKELAIFLEEEYQLLQNAIITKENNIMEGF